MRVGALALLCALVLAAPAPSQMSAKAPPNDILCLKDGRIFDRIPMERVDGGVKLRFENGEVFVPGDLVQDVVLESDATAAPKDAEEAEQKKNGFVRFEGKWVPEKKRAELIAKRIEARRADLEEIKAHGEWRNRYIEETKNFRFEYTIAPSVFAEYREALEAFFKEFGKVWKLETPKGNPKLPVNIYGSPKEFYQVSGVGAGTLAYFRFVKPWDLNGYHDRMDVDFSKQVFYHEFTHYLVKLVDLDFAYPHFPNESVAEYYGASKYDPATKKFTTGLLQDGRLCEIEADIAAGERMPLQKIVGGGRMYEHYNWGWSLVHFLMNDDKLRPKFTAFFLALSKGKGVRREEIGMDNLRTCSDDEIWRVFCESLGLKDADAVRKLEAAWHSDVEKKIVLATARGKGMAAIESKKQGRKLRAKRLFQEALDGGNQSPVVFHEYADLLMSDGKYTEGIAVLKKALERDPLNGWFHGTMSRALLAQGKKDEAAKARKLAREIGYDDPWILVQIEDEAGEDDGGEDKPKRAGG